MKMEKKGECVLSIPWVEEENGSLRRPKAASKTKGSESCVPPLRLSNHMLRYCISIFIILIWVYVRHKYFICFDLYFQKKKKISLFNVLGAPAKYIVWDFFFYRI